MAVVYLIQQDLTDSVDWGNVRDHSDLKRKTKCFYKRVVNARIARWQSLSKEVLAILLLDPNPFTRQAAQYLLAQKKLSIEDRINKYLRKQPKKDAWDCSITIWTFSSDYFAPIELDGQALLRSPSTTRRVVTHVKRLIEAAPLVECLTSSTSYVREYRAWFEKQQEPK